MSDALMVMYLGNLECHAQMAVASRGRMKNPFSTQKAGAGVSFLTQ